MWLLSNWLRRHKQRNYRRACREQDRFDMLLEQMVNWNTTPQEVQTAWQATTPPPHGKEKQEERFKQALEASEDWKCCSCSVEKRDV